MHKKKEIQDFQPINIDWITTGNAWKVNKNIKLGAVLGSLEMTNYIFFWRWPYFKNSLWVIQELSANVKL